MRRNSKGTSSADEFLLDRIARVERHDPEQVIPALEPFVGERRREKLLEIIGKRIGSVAVLFDSPYDPHNGAAIIRSCDAFGVQALHVVERETTPFLAAMSVARGSEKWIDIHRYKKPEESVAHFQAEGFTLVSADADGELTPSDLGRIPKLALVLGNEHDGVSHVLRDASNARVRIPMRGFAESLNVSVSAAILLAYATEGRASDLDEKSRRKIYARGLYLSLHHADEILAAASVT